MRSLCWIGLVVGIAAPARAATYTVNSTLDGDDAAADGVCDDGAGHCTLRAAITQALRDGGGATIQFAIAGSGVHTFTPATPYPNITASMILDATTQAGYAGTPLVEIDGANAGTSAKGFFVTTAFGSTVNVTIRGLAIGGFAGVGIYITAATAKVSANWIGLTAAGVRNGNAGGVFATSALGAAVTIGGATSGDRNVISGNLNGQVSVAGAGAVVENNYIGPDPTGTMVVDATQTGISGGTGPLLIQNNLISGNATGVAVDGSGVTLENNLIGTDASGAAALGNGVGVLIDTSGSGNTISGNVVSGNSQAGILLQGCDSNTISGNFIGTNAAGTAAVGNATGVSMTDNPRGNTIGGTTTAARNVISGNTDGIVYASGSMNSIVGNYIGLDVDGNALGNSRYGVDIQATDNAVIGGTGGALPNVISANGTAGVHVGASGTPAITIVGNDIGTSPDGASARGNGVGVKLEGSTAVVIGAANGGNLISGNNGDGIELLAGTQSTTIAANFIGTNGSGAAVANQRGILVDGGSHDNLIGDANGAGNRIAFNLQEGILVNSGTLDQIEGNSIVGNGALGIDLAPIGVNTNQVSGTGPNGLMPFPMLLSATNDGTHLWVAGTMGPGTMQTAAVVEFFSSASCDPSGYGEGDTLVARNAVDTDSHGAFLVMLPSVAVGQNVSATAFDMNLGTSEFSPCLQVKACPMIALAPVTLPDGDILQSYSQTVTASGGTTPYAFSVTAGTLPSGLTLASDGTLSGTPMAFGTFQFTVGVSDATHCVGARAFSLFIAAPGVDLGGPDLAFGGVGDDAGVAGDAGVADDFGGGGAAPDLAVGGGGKSGCSFAADSGDPSSLSALVVLLLALGMTRARRRVDGRKR